jgi:A-kinase anchor protein 1, mitochondrial
MIAKRPIYYTILPSIVIIIGYVWYRRKRNGRVDCDTGGGSKNQQQQQKSCKLVDEELNDNRELISSDHSYSTLSHHTESLPIGTPQQKQQQQKNLSLKTLNKESSPEGEGKQSQSPGSIGSSSSSSLGKSAPIDIAPNPRSPPKRITEQEIDCEILKLKPEESDIKNLRYIEDPESDIDETPTPVDSPPYRTRFQMNRTQPVVEPVKIVKGTMEAKISPENSFRERKYTQTELDDNERMNDNGGHCKGKDDREKMRMMQNGNETLNSNDNGCVMQEDDEVTAATDSNEKPVNSSTPTRTQPQIASPSLSICSMHSGDSGQGSSPPVSLLGVYLNLKKKNIFFLFYLIMKKKKLI